ncbi:MAG TPA: FAD/NAD(P)-binding oxidoreductase [Spirochaetia bacterium]|nr:FAD/NAD(P)-binding oxidoreductase [Spirochaetia bacterium]
MTEQSAYRYIIVGGGIAGFSAARAIRERDPDGSLVILNGEDRLPYKRTKISKRAAAGFSRDDFSLEPEKWYQENRIDLITGRSADGLSIAPQRVHLDSGSILSWERLILASGARPVLPPGVETSDRDGIHVVRSAAQVEHLRRAIEAVGRVAIVGSGVLGVEVCEQVRLLGKEVLLIGSGPLPLSNRLNGDLAQMLSVGLSGHGVELHMNERILGVTRDENRPKEGRLLIETTQGQHSADLVVFCIGVQANVEIAASAGIAVDHGILVDEYLCTSAPGIYAAGDAAEHPLGYVSYLWHAAELQGKIAGSNAAGDSVVHDSPPFRMKCEVFGHYFFAMNRPPSDEGYEVIVEAEGALYRSLYYREGRLCGALMANDKERAKSYVQAVREGWSMAETGRRIPLGTASPSQGI